MNMSIRSTDPLEGHHAISDNIFTIFSLILHCFFEARSVPADSQWTMRAGQQIIIPICACLCYEDASVSRNNTDALYSLVTKRISYVFVSVDRHTQHPSTVDNMH